MAKTFIAFSPSRNERRQERTKSKPKMQKPQDNIMKKKIRYMALTVAALTAALSTFTAQAVEEKLVNESKEALDAFHSKDSSLKQFVGNAAGFAIFPNVGKGGFIVGGAHGDGL